MNGLIKIRDIEPVAVINALVGFLEATIALLVAFGILDLTSEQVGALMATIMAFVEVLKTLWARSQVSPVDGLE